MKTARDARIQRETTRLPQSSAAFDGSLEAFFEQIIAPTLLQVDQVIAFHQTLTEYVRSPTPLFLVRAVARTERRQDYQTRDGHSLRATDNSPAWWVYGALAAGHRIALDSTDSVMRSIPCHMFDVPKSSASVPASAGWHIAHILNAKDRNTDFRSWSRQDLVRRCVRNLHPANYFLLPSTDWQRLGNDATVVDFVASRYRDRYSLIWDEYAELAGFDRDEWSGSAADVPVTLGAGALTTRKARKKETASALRTRRRRASPLNPEPTKEDARDGAPSVTYRATRLLFKRDLIEPLGDSERFRIETPVGDFELTKSDFYREFAGVVASRSYREGGVYHFPKPPLRAERFRVPT